VLMRTRMATQAMCGQTALTLITRNHLSLPSLGNTRSSPTQYSVRARAHTHTLSLSYKHTDPGRGCVLETSLEVLVVVEAPAMGASLQKRLLRLP